MIKEETSKHPPTPEFDILREKEENLQALLQVSPVGVSILGEDRIPIYTNPALENLLGIPDE